jgi:hypothetical protein
MLAVGAMSPKAQTLLFLIALVLLVAGGVGWKPGTERVRLESLGLAFFVFVYFWNALAGSGW